MLIVIRGLPGSGKSTLARRLVSEQGYAHFEADMFHLLTEKGLQQTDVGEAHLWCRERVREAMQAGKDVVVSNVFSSMTSIAPYELDAKALNVPMQIWRAGGALRSTHPVSESAIKAMAAAWEDLPTERIVMPELLESPSCGPEDPSA